jgi:CheY-like chemotaxis protein
VEIQPRIDVNTQPFGQGVLEGGNQAKASDPSLPTGTRILVAEDGPDHQRLIQFMLKKAGAQVTLADHGRIAYERVISDVKAGQPFDLILMDMQMPEMDGYTAVAALRQSVYVGPIIALTAHAMAEGLDKCMEAGCNDCATKPLDRAKLIQTIRRHLSQSAPLKTHL